MTVRADIPQGTRPGPPRAGSPGLTRTRSVRALSVHNPEVQTALQQFAQDVSRQLQEIGYYMDETGRVHALEFLGDGIRTGRDRKLVTGTAGTNGELLEWNADGDAVDSGVTADSVVEGPASAADNSVPTYDGTTGKLLQDKAVIFVEDGGNVGLGTASPRTTIGRNVEIEASSTAARLSLDCTDTSGREYALFSDLNGKFGVYDWDGTTYRIAMDSSGNVGIGTYSPRTTVGTNLEVEASSTAARLSLDCTQSSGREYSVFSDNGGRFGVYDWDGTAYRVVVDSSGNFGIGNNTSPAQSLHVNSGRIRLGTVDWAYGTGSPEGSVTANVGSFYSRTDGGAGTSFYVKESGTGNTGWVAK